MLISVVWRIPLLENVASIWLKLEPQGTPDIILPWRRRSRLRKTLHRLRSIRRTNPRLFTQYQRINQDIYVELTDEQHVTLFLLMWPPDYPQWIRINNDQIGDDAVT
jgi:hypothetical protein